MARTFTALGVEFDFSQSQEGEIVVRNKPSRVGQIVDALKNILRSARLSAAEATALRGRLQFAESQTFGRAVALHMKSCQMRALNNLPGVEVTPAMREELEWAREFVENSFPRLLKTHVQDNRVLIFTDACLEDGDSRAGVGMTAYIWKKGRLFKKFVAGDVVPQYVLKALQKSSPKVIAALELLAAVMSLELIRHYLGATRVFLFVDNEAARANLIAMSSPVRTHADILKKLYRLSSVTSLFMWVSRVPSASNEADLPSRGQVDHLVQQGFERLKFQWPDMEE
eukprot:Skav236018  [mRNA]  locus=scaffold3189:230237:231088:- [translate_table: standard]